MPNIAAPSDPKPEETVFLDVKLRMAWERYGNLVYVLCGLGAAAILAREGLKYLADQKELEVEKEYAAATTPEAYKQFAADHRGHPLTALVELKFADESYQNWKFADATAGYGKAIVDLPPGPFQDRARLGLALSQARDGKLGDAEATLRQILNDDSQLKSLRCEAGYDLADIAASSGRAEDVQKLAERLMQIDPTSPYAERAFALRSELPAQAPSAPAIAVPGSH
jgi:tetratricopeptide (TPR) repeat protein